MRVKEIIKKYEELGVNLWLENDKLHYKAPAGVLDDKRIAELKNYKEDIIVFLEKAKHVTIEAMDIVEKAKEYWKKELSSAVMKPEMPLLENSQGFKVGQKKYLIDKNKWEYVINKSEQENIVPSNVMLAAFIETIKLWSRNQEFCINVIEHKPPEANAQINKTFDISSLNNILKLNSKPDRYFIEKIKDIQAKLQENEKHSSFLEYKELVEDKNEDKLVLTFENSLYGNSSDFYDISQINCQSEQARSLLFSEWIKCQLTGNEENIFVSWTFREDIFPVGMIDEAFEAFIELLNKLTSEEQSWQENFPVELPKGVKETRLRRNGTVAKVERKLLYDGFCENVKNKPKAIALCAEGRHFTYQELANCVESVQQALLNKGLKTGDIVCISLEKGLWQIAAALGVLIAGGVYLPLDISQPQSRKNIILNNSQTRYMITNNKQAINTGKEDIVTILVEELKLKDFAKIKPIMLDAKQPAYIIYTSGSTGEPKGVVINHHAALNTIEDMIRKFKITSEDKVLSIASFAFDLSVFDIFGILTVGGTIVLPNSDKINNPEHWTELLKEEKFTIWNTVPAQMQIFITHLISKNYKEQMCLRLVLLSGDWIPVSLPKSIKNIFPFADIISLGGATEASIWSIYYPVKEIPEDAKSIPYGMPLSNQQFYILDKQSRECPNWVTGDLYIGGIGLADEYLGDPILTEEKFIIHPKTKKRLYYTGDIGRYRPDGIIEFLGREDTQVKIRGRRIELSEIESVLQKHPAINQAIVLVSEDNTQNNRICSFVEARHLEKANLETEDNQLGEIGAKSVEVITESVDRALFTQWIDLENKVALLSMLKTLQQVGLFTNSTKEHDFLEIKKVVKVISDLEGLLKNWLDSLCSEKIIKRDMQSEKYSLIMEENTDKLLSGYWEKLNSIESKAKFGSEFLNYFHDCNSNLLELLSGNINSLDILFPQGKLTRALALYQNHICSRILNHIIKDCVLKLVKEHTTSEYKRPLRILEVGAGVGGTSNDLIPALDGYNVEYYFTDISPFFLNEAKERFEKYLWVNYGLYDINKNYWEQGLKASQFDIIICSNVLHNALNGTIALATLKELSVPGGILMVFDTTKEEYYMKTSMKFNDGLAGLTEFTDCRSVSNTTFFRHEQWEDMFKYVNAKLLFVYPSKSDILSAAGQTLFITNFSRDKVKIYPEELQEYLIEYLPSYMIPTHIEVLHQLPLTGNGKIDRNALKRRIEGYTSHYQILEEEPQNDTERKLAHIWKTVLNRESIGRKDNFFVVGGDSLLIAQVVSKMWEQLPETKNYRWDELVKQIMQTPTIAELSEKLRIKDCDLMEEAYKSKEEIAALVILAEGKQENAPMKVLFHTGTGTLTAYNDLVRLLVNAPDRIETIGGFIIENHEEFFNIPDEDLFVTLGKKYAEVLLKQKAISFELVGHCIGGLIAMEAARVLIDKGVNVKPVILINSTLNKHEKSELWKISQAALNTDMIMERIFGRLLGADMNSAGYIINDDKLLRALKSIKSIEEETFKQEDLCLLEGAFNEVGACYRELSLKTQPQRLRELYKTMPDLDDKLSEYQENTFHKVYQVFRKSFKASFYYKPLPFPGDINVLKCKCELEDYFIDKLGIYSNDKEIWDKLVEGKVFFEYIRGDHFSCLKPPFVEALVRAIC